MTHIAAHRWSTRLAALAVPVALLPLVLTAGAAPALAAVPSGGAAAVVSRMTLSQRVGQLFMVGSPATAASPATLRAISDYHVGNVMLTGRSFGGTLATARVSAVLRARATRTATYGVPLLVATDQEGGAVQVLRGPGFSRMPTALRQGTWSTTYLRTSAKAWGRQLRAAGVNVNLAPVLDTVPGAAAALLNPPIGYYHREFGYTSTRVTTHGRAFLQGMEYAGVSATAKHFPGLGRVTANPDVSAHVTDRITTRHSAYIAPFAAAVNSGVPMLMMSTAYYSRIDPYHPAAFSRFIIRDMVRGDLGFRGVIVSDDLGAARQVAAWSPGSRAVQFLRAGGDLVLTVDPSVLPAMQRAVLARAQTNTAFRAHVTTSAVRVLLAKQHRGLIPPPASAAIAPPTGLYAVPAPRVRLLPVR